MSKKNATKPLKQPAVSGSLLVEIKSLLEQYRDEEVLDTNCPNCGREYDEIDDEFQICHYCGFNNN